MTSLLPHCKSTKREMNAQKYIAFKGGIRLARSAPADEGSAFYAVTTLKLNNKERLSSQVFTLTSTRPCTFPSRISLPNVAASSNETSLEIVLS